MFSRLLAPVRVRTRRKALTRAQWVTGAYFVFGVVVFAAVLIARFPYAETVSSMLAPLQLRLSYHSQQMNLPFGAKLEDVRLFSTAGPVEHLVVQSSDLSLSPTLASLILGRPGLRLRAALYGGSLDAILRKHLDLIDIEFALNSLDLEQSAPLRQFGATLTGTVSGAGSAELRGPRIDDSNATVTLDGSAVAVEIAHGFPMVHLGVVRGGFILENGIVTLKDLKAHGGDLDLDASGTIRLAPDLTDCTIDARVSLRPTPSGRARFGLFVRMLPHGPNGGPFKLSGPLLSPSIN